MSELHLSDVFRYVQRFGQKGHQIGRKVGDAIEVITLGMIYRDDELKNHLVIEAELEGESTAKHKVEFAFFENDEALRPNRTDMTKLFGFIECKKVGVEQTVKQAFKNWPEKNREFFATDGFSFTINPRRFSLRGRVSICDWSSESPMLSIETGFQYGKEREAISVSEGDNIAFAVDVNGHFHLVGGDDSLNELSESIVTCTIVHVKKVTNGKVAQIYVEDCLTGPQTPEKAKQASFVALDVRKKITGNFDKQEDDSKLSSVLVIGEPSHWEKKSRAIVGLCIDHVLIIPDLVVIEFFETVAGEFGDNYQGYIKKGEYIGNAKLRASTEYVIEKFNGKILRRIDSEGFIKPKIGEVDERPSLELVDL